MAIPKSGEAIPIDVVVLKIVTCFEEVLNRKQVAGHNPVEISQNQGKPLEGGEGMKEVICWKMHPAHFSRF